MDSLWIHECVLSFLAQALGGLYIRTVARRVGGDEAGWVLTSTAHQTLFTWPTIICPYSVEFVPEKKSDSPFSLLNPRTTHRQQ